MIKAVIFDMDGLLIDSEPLWRRANYLVCHPLGVDLEVEDYRQFTGVRSKEVITELYRRYPWTGPSQQEVETMIFEQVIKLIHEEGALKPGVHHTLQICKAAKLPVAIASSSPTAVIEAVVAALEIQEHFKHIFSAEFETYGKPHPAVFLKTAEHFKVKPSDCLVFEDSPFGVLAAKAAKMNCVAVPDETDKSHAFVQTADKIIDSLEEFDQTMLKSF